MSGIKSAGGGRGGEKGTTEGEQSVDRGGVEEKERAGGIRRRAGAKSVWGGQVPSLQAEERVK